MSLLHQPADNIAAHPAKADHAELHFLFPLEFDSDHFEFLLQYFGSGGAPPLPWGEGWGEGGRSNDGSVPLTRIASCDAIRPLPKGEVTSSRFPSASLR